MSNAKPLYRDIEALRDFGLDIVRIKGRPVAYALASRVFSFGELSLIVDAVSSSRFLTEREGGRARPLDQTPRLGPSSRTPFGKRPRRPTREKPKRQRVRERRRVAGGDSHRSQGRVLYYTIDVSKRRVARRDGKRYLTTPWRSSTATDSTTSPPTATSTGTSPTTASTAWAPLRITDEPATRNETTAAFDVRAYQSGSFGMFAGERRNVTLLVNERAMGGVVDRFGDDMVVTPAPDVAAAREGDPDRARRRRAGRA